MLTSVGDAETVAMWNIEPIVTLPPLLYGCAWAADHLRTNSDVAEGDRTICTDL